ncbi:MAG: NAD-dependent epimerase/dehydratase family protein [Candidatus Melainabacteria bacterium]|jgi:UDP-glucose 4-epimerase|uniref:UDP-glucose 4-epimerase n=1 Tax=Candidatus Obscuribacter phosphatis TaxID=1906157 RepID=A0A8J7P9D1_9BACT|nr:NAD-dependent epimerase/dehydratase family protein [Candidatus Obscuribacter phosphatis]MCA0315956.1 NAD-dependent epimerase/dehydratase family protein [Candidatus Melainabacteria bacterium]OPZ88088.1 MAG: dTDP-4-dehydro-6-deoxyglucose reductase [bacterium ADurb.Bin425]
MKAKALVIGGNGFIGTNLVQLLVDSGHQVRVFDRYPSRFQAPLPQVEYLSGDIGNHGEMEEAVKGMDWVFHLAYTTLPQTSNDDPVYDIRSNIADTVQLLTECVKTKVKKFVFISSGGTVYGVPTVCPIKEDHPTEPICSYGISKLSIEKYLHLFEKLYGLDYVVARISNPYGELQNPNAKQGAIGVFLGNVARKQPITIWGDGEVIRDYIYIGDTVKALLSCAEYKAKENSPRIFNIGHGEGHTLNEIVEVIKEVVGPQVEVKYTPARPVDVPVNVLDIKRAERYLNWTPQTGLKEGITRSWNWINSLQLI